MQDEYTSMQISLDNMHITHNLPLRKNHFLLFFGQFLISRTAVFSFVLQVFYHPPANQSIKIIREFIKIRTSLENTSPGWWYDTQKEYDLQQDVQVHDSHTIFPRLHRRKITVPSGFRSGGKDSGLFASHAGSEQILRRKTPSLSETSRMKQTAFLRHLPAQQKCPDFCKSGQTAFAEKAAYIPPYGL